MNELCHFGIKGQKWGVRRFQNEDGSLKPAGRGRYSSGSEGEYTYKSKQQLKYEKKVAADQEKGVTGKRAEKNQHKLAVYKTRDSSRQEYVKNELGIKDAAKQKEKLEGSILGNKMFTTYDKFRASQAKGSDFIDKHSKIGDMLRTALDPIGLKSEWEEYVNSELINWENDMDKKHKWEIS